MKYKDQKGRSKETKHIITDAVIIYIKISKLIISKINCILVRKKRSQDLK